MAKVKLRFAPYMRGPSLEAEITATVRGDLAIHRPAWVKEDGSLSIYAKCWTVSHIPSGDSVESAFPARFKRNGANKALKSQIVTWTEDLQAACPEFFTAARANDQAAMKLLAGDLFNKAKAL